MKHNEPVRPSIGYDTHLTVICPGIIIKFSIVSRNVKIKQIHDFSTFYLCVYEHAPSRKGINSRCLKRLFETREGDVQKAGENFTVISPIKDT
jgi:hypothetical protein